VENLIERIKRLSLPPLYTQENESDPILYLRFYLLGFSWVWFPCEAKIEENDILFYGFVTGDEQEFGYFRLSEICGTSLPFVLDANFSPMKFSEAKKIYGFRQFGE
jgi:hypothetical protein